MPETWVEYNTTFQPPVKTSIFVPSTKFDKKISKKQFMNRIKDARSFLNKTFGGTTRLKGVGLWETCNLVHLIHLLIEEDVVIVESYSTRKDYLAKDQILRDYIQKKLISWKQHAISVEYNNKLYIIS